MVEAQKSEHPVVGETYSAIALRRLFDESVQV